MIHTILDEIKGKILDLQYVERYGSIVVPVSQDVEDEDGRSKRITFPASWDGQGKACYAANDYFELAPNDVYRSVSYWELRGDAVPFVPRRGDRGKWYGFRQSARLVVWLNLQVLGIPETGNKLSDHLSVLTMNALQGAHQVGVDYIDGVRMTVERKVRKSMDIFGAYSYSDRNELLLYPYDFFAIDFQVEWYIKRDCIPGEIPYKALRCAPIEVPGGGAWTPGPGEEECNCRWIDLPDRPTKLSDFENDLPCSFQSVDTLPEDPDECIIYLHDGKYWAWDGSQWIDITPASGVMSVTGDGVDNTDPVNPVLSFPDADQVDDSTTTNKFVTQQEKDDIASAIQPGDLGTAATSDVGDFATAAQGSKADSAVQPDDTDVSGNDWVLDEDGMVSDSDTKVPTQQSVKAYVDANAGGSPVNLFTDDLTLSAHRLHDLGDYFFHFNGYGTQGSWKVKYTDGMGTSAEYTMAYDDMAFVVKQSGLTAGVRALVDVNDVLALTISTGQGSLNADNKKYLKRINILGRAEWGDIEIPEYATDTDADNDSDLASGAPYSITGDRTVYRKP